MKTKENTKQQEAGVAWYTKEVISVFKELHTDEGGLKEDEAKRRIKEYGLNKLPEAKVDSVFLIFFRQFQSPLIYILLAASATTFLMGEVVDSGIILAVLLFNATVGTIQEGKAQNTLVALRNFTETKATVLRNGQEVIISDHVVVPGDIIFLQEGEKVPADARIISSHNLKADEAAFTGESEPVQKTVDILKKSELPANEQKNMVFKGTNIVAGNGKAVVVGTGLSTFVGKIAKDIAAIDTEIPLKANIRNLSKIIIFAVFSVSTFIFTYGILTGRSAKEMFFTVVSLSVSTIPEGLPIVITLVLATGVWRMSKRNVLVKKLQAVEALGQARCIAVDKTGTITKNELVVQKVFVGGKMFDIEGVGYEPKGKIKLDEHVVDAANHKELLLAGRIAALCANAQVMYQKAKKQWRVAGDPTEAAMLVFAQKLGIHKDELERESPLIDEIPFDYELKYHAVMHKEEAMVVGAPEVILKLSSKMWDESKSSAKLNEKQKEKFEATFQDMSKNGLRVVAFAKKEKMPGTLNTDTIHSLVFLGFFGMKDALRPEVAHAMLQAAQANIRVVMITGDHKITAQTIAKEAGIFRNGDQILTGDDINGFSDSKLADCLGKTTVFARVTPEHKLRIIRAYRARGEIVAMTGDGINDAPSLVAADLGVAMGKIGTEVAKEASDIVLLDDNFGSIIAGVEEGRSIYKTIKKVILFLFSTSIGEVLTISSALIVGLPLPILPSQIIWLNFVTDGFLTAALAMEPKEDGLLKGNFEKPKKYIIDKLMVERMPLMAIPMAIGTIILFTKYLEVDPAKAWTMSLTTLAVFQWFNAWNCRSEEKSMFQMNPFTNPYLIWGTLTVVILQLFAVYTPVLQKLLRTVPLDLYDWLIIIPVAASIVLVEEVRKYFKRR